MNIKKMIGSMTAVAMALGMLSAPIPTGSENMISSKASAEVYDEFEGMTKTTPSKDCKFYNIKLKAPKKSKVSAADKKKALSVAMNSSIYKSEVLGHEKEIKEWVSSDYIDPAVGKYISSDGKITPKVSFSYNYDFDGDGKKESFIVIETPIGEYPSLGCILVFKNSKGSMVAVDSFQGIGFDGEPMIIDYGKFKHLCFGGGSMGATENYKIYGFKNNKLKKYLSGRIFLNSKKCMLIINSPQGCGGTFYYDTVKDEYILIRGVEQSINSILKMDKKNSLGWDDEYKSMVKCRLIAGKYYIFYMENGIQCDTFVYENGEFKYLDTYSEDGTVRGAKWARYGEKYYVDDIGKIL